MEQPSPVICPLCRFPVGPDSVCTNPNCHTPLNKGDWSLPEAYSTIGLIPPGSESGPFLVAPSPEQPPVQGRVRSSLPLDLDPLTAVFHIGGSMVNHIQIAGAASPHQVSIHLNRRSKDWWAFDWSNGSDATINGERFRNLKLKDDDILCVAGVSLRYRCGQIAAEYGTAEGVDVVVSDLTDARMSDTSPPHPLLDHVSFVVPDGEFVGIIGRSGCGKSTLIKTLAGLVTPAAGSVTFNGVSRSKNSAAIRACTAYLPQAVDATLHHDLTLEQEIASFSAIHLAARDIAREDTLLKDRGLLKMRNARIEALSGGERRRAAFLLALLREPSVLLLDEPAAGLDRATEKALMEDLRQMSKSGARKTILCATHELANIHLFDRVLVMADGQLVYNGPPSALFDELRIPGEGDERFEKLYEHLGDISHHPAIQAGIRKNRQTPQPSHDSPIPETRKPASCLGSFLGYLGRFARTSIAFAQKSISTPTDGTWWRKAWFGIQLATKWAFNGPLVSFLWQPLLVAFCLCAALKSSYTAVERDQKIVFFCAAIAAFWLGMAGSVRSLVSSRSGRSLERLEGVSRMAYLGAVSVATLGKGVLQGAILTFFLYLFPTFLGVEQPWSTALASILGIGRCVVAVECMGGFAGLALSSICPSESMAVALVPNLAIVALFFSQPLMDFNDDATGFAVQFARNLPAHDAHLAMFDRNNAGLLGVPNNRPVAETTLAYLIVLFLLSLGSQSFYERNWKG